MEDILLTDAAERFARNEMPAEERMHFENMRRNDPAFDLAVTEHLAFLSRVSDFAAAKSFREKLVTIADKFSGEHKSTSQPAKVILLWRRYRRTVSVAASIACIVSLFIATVISSVNKNKDNNIKQLVGTLDTKTRNIENRLNMLAAKTNPTAVPKVQSNFRATGFMIDAADNYIVTNAHVVKEAMHQLIVENNNGDEFTATAVYVNPANDIAVLKITDSSFKSLPAAPYSIRRTGAELGESIFMLGYPKQEIVYAEGYVSARNGYEMDTVFCQLSATANEGNSGSPVLTTNGELVGVLSSTETNATGVVFAIKSANIFSAIDAIKKIPGNENIHVTTMPSLKGLDRVSQIRKTEDYVFMIKGN